MGSFSQLLLPAAAEAAILAGGASRRMGRDKASLDLGGRSLVERLALTLEPLFDRIRLIGGRPDASAPSWLSVQPDLRAGLGPLGGIHTALTTAERGIVFVIACDFPFITRSLVTRMAALIGAHDAVVPRTEGRPLPVCAFYRSVCLGAVERHLEGGERRAARFLDAVDVRWIDDEELRTLDPGGTALVNVNTPEDYERAKAIAASLELSF